jgi:hypothetical protein
MIPGAKGRARIVPASDLPKSPVSTTRGFYGWGSKPLAPELRRISFPVPRPKPEHVKQMICKSGAVATYVSKGYCRRDSAGHWIPCGQVAAPVTLETPKQVVEYRGTDKRLIALMAWRQRNVGK